jgi:hypothetical protein
MILGLLIAFLSNAYATVDSNSNVYILVRHIQSEEYFVQKAPIVGCYGLPRGPQLSQLTKSYIVNNVGCGMDSQENINALTCAIVVDAVEADDFSTFKKVILDISDCADKNNSDFIHGIKKVFKLNFFTKTVPHPALILIKTDGKKLL